MHRPGGQAVTCRVQALDSAHGVVGVVDVGVPPSAERSVHQRGRRAHDVARGRPASSTALHTAADQRLGSVDPFAAARAVSLAASPSGLASHWTSASVVGVRAALCVTSSGRTPSPTRSPIRITVSETVTAAATSYLTQEAYDRLKAELDQLSGAGRTEIAKKHRGGPRGGRPQGERRLPRRQGGAGQDGGPHPPADPAARERHGRRDARRQRHRRARHGRDRRHVRRRRGRSCSAPARSPTTRPRGLQREVPARRRHQRQEDRRHGVLQGPQRQDHRGHRQGRQALHGG